MTDERLREAAREKERLAQALRDGDMATFTKAIRAANRRPLCLACLILMGCNKGRNHDGPCHRGAAR